MSDQSKKKKKGDEDPLDAFLAGMDGSDAGASDEEAQRGLLDALLGGEASPAGDAPTGGGQVPGGDSGNLDALLETMMGDGQMPDAGGGPPPGGGAGDLGGLLEAMMAGGQMPDAGSGQVPGAGAGQMPGGGAGDLGGLLEAMMGGGQMPDAGSGQMPGAGAGGAGGLLGALLGGGGGGLLGALLGGGGGTQTGGSSMLQPLAQALADKLNVSPQVAMTLIGVALNLLGNMLQEGQGGTRGGPGQASVDDLMDEEYLQSSGVASQVAAGTGLDEDQAAEGVREALLMLTQSP